MAVEMSDLGDQYRCPMGRRGRLVATLMNQNHEPLTLWGLTKIAIGSDNVILDVGCGGGKTVGKLAALSPKGKVFGLDYSVDMVKFSKRINKKLIAQNRVEIIEGSVEKMSFKDDFFDLVTAFETYYFWNNFPVALKEIKRVLKTGGKFLLVNELMYGITPAKVIEETHVRLFPLKKIQNDMQTVGFTVINVFTEVESPWNAIIAQK
jgi:ubiquinone/menaquinone biosynthesis C-methylase UbiE